MSVRPSDRPTVRPSDRSYTPKLQCPGDGQRGPRHPAARSRCPIRMFMSPCPASTINPHVLARSVRTAAAFAARSRALLKLSTPAAQPQNHADRASPAHMSGRRRSPDRKALGNSASRKHGSISGVADGASHCAESRDRRSVLATIQFAVRVRRSSSALGWDEGSSGASASPRSHSPSACPGIRVRKSHAGLPCRASTILLTSPRPWPAARGPEP